MTLIDVPAMLDDFVVNRFPDLDILERRRLVADLEGLFEATYGAIEQSLDEAHDEGLQEAIDKIEDAVAELRRGSA